MSSHPISNFFLVLCLALGLYAGIAALVSLIRLRGETANSFKLRTLVFIILAFGPYKGDWILTIPLFLFMAYRSFRAGQKAPKGMGSLASGRFGSHPNAKGWIPGVLGVIVAFLPDGKPNDDKYYFDGNGEPYAYAQPDQFLDARDGW
jgi:hypothetical protein